MYTVPWQLEAWQVTEQAGTVVAESLEALSNDLSSISNARFIRVPGSATAKPAVIVHAAMQFLGHHHLLSHSIAHPDLQYTAIALAASAHHKHTLACQHPLQGSLYRALADKAHTYHCLSGAHVLVWRLLLSILHQANSILTLHYYVMLGSV